MKSQVLHAVHDVLYVWGGCRGNLKSITLPFLQEKLCHEIAGGLTEDIISQNIRPELNRVEGQLHFLEKEENELRRVSAE